jgi:nitrilase
MAASWPGATNTDRWKASLTVALAQIAPVWLDRAATLAKVNSYVEQAARQSCGLVAFGEALVPGYPFLLELTDGE